MHRVKIIYVDAIIDAICAWASSIITNAINAIESILNIFKMSNTLWNFLLKWFGYYIKRNFIISIDSQGNKSVVATKDLW